MHARLGRISVIALLGLAVALGATAQDPHAARVFRLDGAHELLGGLSGVEINGDGTGGFLLSDRGTLFEVGLTRDVRGHVQSVALTAIRRLTARNGNRGERGDRDSEGLALAPDGRLFISYEGDHRVALRQDGGETILPAAPGFARLQPNASLEALAIDAAGTIYTLPERSGAEDRPFPLFRYRNGQWDRDLTVPRRGRYLPVGADFDDRGRFYLLERDFTVLFGFSSRIRRFEITETGLMAEETLLRTRHGTYSNLEGLAIWRAVDGQLMATLVSDDNFSPILPTQLVEIPLD